MRRRLFNFATTASLVLCLATVVLWACDTTYFGTYLVKSSSDTAYNEFTVTLIGKSLAAGYIRTEYVPYPPQTSEGLESAMAKYAGYQTGYRPLFQPNFSFRHKQRTDDGTWLEYSNQFGGKVVSDDSYTAAIPLSILAGAMAMAPIGCLAASAKRLRQSHRRRSDECPKCGYSLTGNTSGVCPECGRRS